MSKAYVQFSDATATKIVAHFAGAQSIQSFPHQGEVDEGDARFLAFLRSVSASAVVSRRQGRLALLDAGKLDEVESLISAIPDAALKRRAQIEYDADTWERGNAFLQSVWSQLGGTPEGLDALFASAATK